jgi:hypothetical protein
MFSLTELRGQSSLLHKSGTVEINTEYSAHRKPVWLVLLKMLGVIGMVAVGAAIAVPTLLEYKFPLWHAVVITAGGMLIYIGIAFFLRPEPNTDNLGWGGGMANDPFQYSDNINRFLWNLHCVLGPGRFTAETLLDLCVLVGLAKSEDDDQETTQSLSALATTTGSTNPFDPTRPIPPLDPNRFGQAGMNFAPGQVALDSQRFFQSTAPPTAAG